MSDDYDFNVVGGGEEPDSWLVITLQYSYKVLRLECSAPQFRCSSRWAMDRHHMVDVPSPVPLQISLFPRCSTRHDTTLQSSIQEEPKEGPAGGVTRLKYDQCEPRIVCLTRGLVTDS